MALATQADVEAALQRELTAEEADDVDSQLEAASDLVVGELHPCPIPSPVPGPIARVAAEMVASLIRRLANNPTLIEGTTSLSAGSFGMNLPAGATAAGPWLTAAQKVRLKPYRCGNGAVSVSLGSDRYL